MEQAEITSGMSDLPMSAPPGAEECRYAELMISLPPSWLLDKNKTIYFWALIPLYEEEMRFKLDHGLDPLLDRLDAGNVNELLNIKRKNVCRRSWW